MIENTKQVIVVRRDLGMSVGKICAQVSHASMAFLTKEMDWFSQSSSSKFRFETQEYPITETVEIDSWLKSSFRKIVVAVDSEEELLDIHQKALENCLISHLVEDNGLTEFNGVKTKTCVAIGPHKDSRFEGITNHLPLYK